MPNERRYIGARYIPTFGRRGESSIDWDASAPYEPLTIVLYEGDSYTSRTYVPIGVPITNTDYWAKTGNYNAQIEEIAGMFRSGRKTITVAASSSETTTITYDAAFDTGTICITTHALDTTSAADTDITCTLASSDEAGLVFMVANVSATDPKTVTIGYFTTGV